MTNDIDFNPGSSVVYEQLRQRTDSDSASLAGALDGMSAALSGGRSVIGADYDANVDGAKDAIAAILKYYRVTPKDVPDEVEGLFARLDYLLRPFGIMWREVELGEGWTKDCTGALLGWFTDGTPVALLPRAVFGYDLYDPALGTRRRLTPALLKTVKPGALCFYKPFPMRSIGLKDLMLYMAGTLNAADYALIGAASFAVALFGLIPGYANKVLFSQVAGVDVSLLPAALCMLAGATLASLLIGVVKSFITTRINTKLGTACESAAMARVLSLPMPFFGRYNSGDLASRVGSIKSLCASLSGAVLTTGLTSLFSLIYIGQIYSFAPSMCVPALLIVLATLAFSIASSLVQMNHSRKLMAASAKIQGLQFALVTGVQKLKLSGSEKRGFAKWAKAYSEEIRLRYNPPAFIKLNSVISLAITLAGTMLMYYTAARSGVGVGEYMAFNVAYGMVSGAFLSLAGITRTIAGIRPLLAMVRPLLETAPESSEGKEIITRISGGFELNNVSFRYDPDQPYILSDITLKVRAGQYIAIVGKTGCGKSTLMKLLLGFEEPETGSVYFDGKDIRGIDGRSLRQHIGTVTQDGKLFQGSIYQNIAISAPQLTLDGAWEAAELAGIADDIRDMPMGMFTMISEDSGGVSGGQRQRIMIARAIAAKPKLLMFDEATSALDNITQKKVSESLDGLKCTRLVIAHRLSTIRQCDRIIVLDHGVVTEDGSYDELITKNGQFAELVARQRLDDTAYVGKTTMF